ncbi:hypothetical protein [Pseudomonas sp. PWP3-1b2]|uniref:hypothetical protein n=1 Tax=Pseudomonas TaxID=286 RepID=UPI003CF88DBB
MKLPEPPASNSFRYFVVGVVCLAMLLGVYFVRLNAQVDRQRAEAIERLTLCRQVENIAHAALPGSLEPSDECKELTERYSETVAP